MDLEISFELKKPLPRGGQNQPATTSTVGYGEIKYIDGAAKRVTMPVALSNAIRAAEKIRMMERYGYSIFCDDIRNEPAASSRSSAVTTR